MCSKLYNWIQSINILFRTKEEIIETSSKIRSKNNKLIRKKVNFDDILMMIIVIAYLYFMVLDFKNKSFAKCSKSSS